MSEIGNFISIVGFPIAAAVFLSLYVIRKDKAAQEQIEKVTTTLTAAHERESEKLAEVIDRNTKAIEGFTRKLDNLTRKIEKE